MISCRKYICFISYMFFLLCLFSFILDLNFFCLNNFSDIPTFICLSFSFPLLFNYYFMINIMLSLGFQFHFNAICIWILSTAILQDNFLFLLFFFIGSFLNQNQLLFSWFLLLFLFQISLYFSYLYFPMVCCLNISNSIIETSILIIDLNSLITDFNSSCILCFIKVIVISKCTVSPLRIFKTWSLLSLFII